MSPRWVGMGGQTSGWWQRRLPPRFPPRDRGSCLPDAVGCWWMAHSWVPSWKLPPWGISHPATGPHGDTRAGSPRLVQDSWRCSPSSRTLCAVGSAAADLPALLLRGPPPRLPLPGPCPPRPHATLCAASVSMEGDSCEKMNTWPLLTDLLIFSFTKSYFGSTCVMYFPQGIKLKCTHIFS